jgi:hypothetical protein
MKFQFSFPFYGIDVTMISIPFQFSFSQTLLYFLWQPIEHAGVSQIFFGYEHIYFVLLVIINGFVYPKNQFKVQIYPYWFSGAFTYLHLLSSSAGRAHFRLVSLVCGKLKVTKAPALLQTSLYYTTQRRTSLSRLNRMEDVQLIHDIPKLQYILVRLLLGEEAMRRPTTVKDQT